MATPLAPQRIGGLGVRGVIRESEVDSSLIPDGAVVEAVNFQFDQKGAATVRAGLTALGSTVIYRNPMPAYGFHNALNGTALVVFNEGGSSAIYRFSGSAWSASLTGGTASVAIRFVDFGSCTVALNFSYDTYASLRYIGANAGFADGASYWKSTGNPINGDQFNGRACTLGEVYKSRLYLSGDTSKEGSTSRLYFSSVMSTAGVITWDRTVDFVDLNPGDGEAISALKRFALELLIFKPNYIYRFRTSGADPDPLIKIGTRSHESVIEGKKGLYFHHDTGFYRYTGGFPPPPTEISRPISDIVTAIPFSQYGSIVSWNDADHIYWSLGNLTIAETKGNVTWKNVVVRFTESSDIWTIYSYANDVRRGLTYNTGSALSRIVALDNGVVATQDSGTTDLGEPIKYRLRTKFYDLGGEATRKIIQEITAICEKAQGLELMYQIDEDVAWYTIGQLTKMVNYFKDLTIRFHRIRFQITGMSRNEAPVFRILEIVKGLNEGLVYD